MDKLKADFEIKALELCAAKGSYDVLRKNIEILEKTASQLKEKNSITFKKAKKTREKISGHKKNILKSKPHKPKMSLENFFYPV